MEPTGVLQRLWDEHRISQRLLDVLEGRLPAAAGGDPEALKVVLGIVTREREYGDRVHHAREELLFSRLASRSDTGAQAVSGLAHDHNELVHMGTLLHELVTELLAGRESDGDLLRTRAGEYADAQRNHMRKEERGSFELAPGILRQEDWEMVAGAYAGREDPLTRPVTQDDRELADWLQRNGVRLS